MQKVTFTDLNFNENYRYPNCYPLFSNPQKEKDKMTLIMGFYVKDAIVLASDSRGILSGGTFNNKRQKIFKIDEKVGVALTGDAQKNYSSSCPNISIIISPELVMLYLPFLDLVTQPRLSHS